MTQDRPEAWGKGFRTPLLLLAPELCDEYRALLILHSSEPYHCAEHVLPDEAPICAIRGKQQQKLRPDVVANELNEGKGLANAAAVEYLVEGNEYEIFLFGPRMVFRRGRRTRNSPSLTSVPTCINAS